MERIKEIEEKILAKARERQAEGWTIARGVTRSEESPVCCALGCFADNRGHGGVFELGALVGMSLEESDAFVCAFDGSEMPVYYETEQSEFCALGRRLASILVDGKDGVE